MEMDFGEAILDSAQHALVPVNFQIGMKAALHQHPRAAEFYGLADFFVDGVKVEDVSFFGLRAFQRTVKRAKGAVLGAEVGVVYVAVDDVSGDAFGMQLAAHGVGFHADSDEVVRAVEVESLLVSQRHNSQNNSTS